MASPERSSGTVTFLFTDIEGSTNLLKRLGRERYGELLERQKELVREAFAAYGGDEVDTQGDSFFAAFRSAPDAVAAAVAIQRSLSDHNWPDGAEVLVRIGIHSGEALASGERYVGFSVHRAARIGGAAHGGQVLLSSSTRELVEDDLPEGIHVRDLGLWRLKDVDRPERITQVAAEGLKTEFPSLRSADQVKQRPVSRRRSLSAAALIGVIAAAVAVPVFAVGGGSSGAAALASVEANAMGAIDSATGRVSASIPIGASPNAVAAGDGSVWAVTPNDDSVVRIDPRTETVQQTIHVGHGPSGIAFGAGFVWVANSLDRTVSKIDPRTESVVQKIPVGAGPSGVAVGLRSVWVTNSVDGTVTRIDPNSGKTVGDPIVVDAGADDVAAGNGAIWVVGESAGVLSRIDPRTSSVVATTNVGNGPSSVAIGRDAVWIANSVDGTLSRIDPGSNEEKAKIPVGAGPSDIAVGANAVWVSNQLGGTLSRIDPIRNAVSSSVEIGNRPMGVAVDGDMVFVTVGTSSRAHRGGVLTVALGFGTGSKAFNLDPAVVYTADGWQRLMVTNDGLVTYKRVGGSEGTVLVPDLATALPTPGAGGRTYTFQLRPGIRYSTGAPVQATDFRRAIERALLSNGSGFYYRGIVDASACTKAQCHLTKGVVADDAEGTVTFHLTAPDPDFLYKLALPSADAVPVSTPLQAQLPLPATGPYMVGSYSATPDNARVTIRLVRNPYFHEWSAAAQPNGFPDQIVERYWPENGVKAVARGSADLTNIAPSDAGVVPSLETQYASQLHVNPSLLTSWFVLNTRLAPFDAVKARQALAYAIDRKRIVRIRGAGLSRLSCQILPSNIAGYRPYCPYSLDLARARKLVAASGTRGESVEVLIDANRTSEAAIGAYLVSVLRNLGYKARITSVPTSDDVYTALNDSRQKIQIAGAVGWSADYPSPSDYFTTNFSCSSFLPANPNNTNESEFCNRRIDDEMRRAAALQTSGDLQGADALWSRVDHDIVDQAPVIAFENDLAADFVSKRVGNYVYSLFDGGALLDQLWVR